jgi:hypothetical protein
MPTVRLAMWHLRDVMRLKAAGMPSREITLLVAGPVGRVEAEGASRHLSTRWVAHRTLEQIGPSFSEVAG